MFLFNLDFTSLYYCTWELDLYGFVKYFLGYIVNSKPHKMIGKYNSKKIYMQLSKMFKKSLRIYNF